MRPSTAASYVSHMPISGATAVIRAVCLPFWVHSQGTLFCTLVVTVSAIMGQCLVKHTHTHTCVSPHQNVTKNVLISVVQKRVHCHTLVILVCNLQEEQSFNCAIKRI